MLMYVDSALISEVNLFIIEGKLRDVDVDDKKLTMVFAKTGTKDEPNIIGTCQFVGEYPLIAIDRDYYNKAEPFEREALVFHELGHCLLGREHCSVKKDGKSVSLMEPIILSNELYSVERTAIVDELFHPNKDCPTAESINGHEKFEDIMRDLNDEDDDEN
jgi:hypothetical protein